MEEEEEKLQKGAKKTGKFVAKQVGKLVGKAIKKIAIAVAQFIIQFLPYILIAVLVVSIVAAVIKFITVNNGSYSQGKEDNVPNAVEEALSDIEISKAGNTYSYDVNLDEKVEELIQKLNSKTNILSTYISEENQKEYLKMFIKADFITQNLKLGNADPKKSDQINGAITVQRSDKDGNVSTLQYIDYTTFKQYIADSNSEVFKYCSINDNGQLVIAQSYRHSKVLDTNVPGETPINEELYNISEMSLDYKSALSSYAMPFNFLWALLVKSTEEDFVYELAKLAMDTEITITAYDNYMRTEETEESQFTMSGRN